MKKPFRDNVRTVGCWLRHDGELLSDIEVLAFSPKANGDARRSIVMDKWDDVHFMVSLLRSIRRKQVGDLMELEKNVYDELVKREEADHEKERNSPTPFINLFNSQE